MKKILITSTELMMLQFLLPHVHYLQENGFKVEVACSEVGERFQEVIDMVSENVRVHRVNLFRSPVKIGNIKGYFELKEILKRGRYDIVWTNEPVMGVITRMAARKMRNHELKVVYMVHGFHFFKGAPLKNWLLYYPIEKSCSYITDLLVTINKEDYMLAKKRLYAKRVKYIPGIGFDTKRYMKVSEKRAEKRSELGIPLNAFVIISVGELGKRKNHEVVIKSIAKCQKEDIYYILCGEGYLEEKLRRLAIKLGIKDKVFFMGYRRDIPELCGCADIMAHPSKREGLGIAALEGMASGLPLVSSYINGIKDYTEEGKTGSCILNPEDVEGFKKGILKFYNNKELIKSTGIYNMEYVKKYDLENVKRIIKKIIEEQL